MYFWLKIQPEVKFDIQDGLNWYREQQEGLDLKFLNEIEQTFSILKGIHFTRLDIITLDVFL